MNLIIKISYSCDEQTKEKENTISLTKNNERPIFILHKKTTCNVYCANNLQLCQIHDLSY